MVAKYLESGELIYAQDGFGLVTVPVSRLLERAGIRELPAQAGGTLPARLYYDDWHLYCLPRGRWGLVKLREQEHDGGDSDDPGVTVSFIGFDLPVLARCLEATTPEHCASLRKELHRVTAQRGQRHSTDLKAYFLDPRAQGPYLIAGAYVRKLRACAGDGPLPIPRNCAALLKTPGGKRLARFLQENNTRAGRTIFDGSHLHLEAAPWDALALLATHTGNTSAHSFAAEIRFHAAFLTMPPLPFLYASALRADMGIHPKEWLLLCPYYRESSHWVRSQKRHHEGTREEMLQNQHFDIETGKIKATSNKRR